MTRRRLAGLAAGLVPLALLLAVHWARGERAARPRPNVLLVTLDTLRADRVGAWGGPPGLTPVLDGLAARGAVFEEAVSSVPLTLPSHATILTGLEPPRHGIHDNGTYALPPDVETLATRLSAAGYATGAFVGAYVLDRRFGLARGFDRYDDRIARANRGASALESERRGGEVAAAATAWLAQQSGPSFAWVHLYDAHAPYDPPPPYRDGHPPYDGEVAYADACVGLVLEAARAAAARAGSGEPLVAVLADHGESLGEHGELTHGFFVYGSTLRIPFLLAGPGVPAGERRGGIARTTDLLPTLLGRLGLPAPAGIDGVDLLGGAPGPPEAYAETLYPSTFGWAPLRSFRARQLKLVEAPRPELYDLAADPQETTDLAERRPDDVERLRRALAAIAARERPPALAAPGADVAERLRSLGYVAASPGAEAAPSAGRPDPKDRVELYRAFEEGVWADARGAREEAIARLRELLSRDPENALFRRTLAAALRRGGRAREAVDVLGRPGAERGDAIAWHERAIALAEAGRLDEAVESGRRAVALDPSLPEPHNHLGTLLARHGETAEALAHFEAAVGLDPNGARAWTNRGNALRDLGRLDEARRSYEQAVERAPADPDPLNGLGVLEVQVGRPQAAADLFRRALAIAPGLGEARLNLAVALVQLGRGEEALGELDALLRAPTDATLAERASRLRTQIREHPSGS